MARTPADWEAVRSLCCRTGNGGDPIDPARWPLFADLWIGPYQRLVPEWTYVAEADGRVIGYLTGCPDTVAFRRARRFRVTLPLLCRIASGRYAWNSDARRMVRLALRLHRGVESRLAPGLPAGLTDTHPAHLHMNVEAECRQRGIGVGLIERYARDLGAAGVPGHPPLLRRAAPPLLPAQRLHGAGGARGQPRAVGLCPGPPARSPRGLRDSRRAAQAEAVTGGAA